MIKASVHKLNLVKLPYYLEDIHMLKNGLHFDIRSLFADNLATFEVTIDPQYKGIVSSGPPSTQSLGPVLVNKFAGFVSHSGSVSPVRIESIKLNVTAVGPTANGVIALNVQFHDGIADVWMTPQNITTMPGHASMSGGFRHRFSIYVRFTDGVVADITGQVLNQAGFHWDFTAGTNYLNWRNTSAVQTNGIFSCASGTAPRLSSPAVLVTLPSYLPYSNPIEGNVTVVTPYSLVATPHGAVKSPIDKHGNVLFLADGYTATQSDLFRQHVNDIVKEFRSGVLSRPWGDLSEKFNFWSAFFPSQEAGGIIHGDCIELASSSDYKHISLNDFISFADLLISSTDAERTKLKASIEANNPALHAAINWSDMSTVTVKPPYTLSQLINIIGYPGFADQNTPFSTITPNFGNTYRFNSLVNDWDPDRINNFTYNIWLLLGNRKCLDQPDTVFSTALGTYFRNPNDLADKDLGFAISPYRTDPIISYKAFLSQLTQGGTNLGSTFFTNAGFLADTTTQLQSGQYVFIINQVPLSGLVGELVRTDNDDQGPYVIIGSRDRGNLREFPCVSVTGSRYRPAPQTLSSLTVSEVSVAIHEFSHHWLLDEYGGGNTLTGKDAAFDYLNLQPEKDTFIPGTTTVTGHQIKWLWPRVQKIGLVTMGIPTAGTSFTVTVANPSPTVAFKSDTSYAPFKNGDFVILRKFGLTGVPVPTHEYPIFSIVVSGDQFTLTYAGRNATYLGASSLPSASLTHSEYLNGKTYIIKPVWHELENPSHFISLVHQDVIKLITHFGKALVPLDKPFGSHGIQKPEDIFLASAGTSIGGMTVNFPKVDHVGRAVGLYAGGMGVYSAGIYHGTGFCLMRNSQTSLSFPTTAITIPPLTTSHLCPVCACILIEAVDFTKYPDYDAHLKATYPS